MNKVVKQTGNRKYVWNLLGNSKYIITSFNIQYYGNTEKEIKTAVLA